MRTLIISDLHLGDGGVYEVFAGGQALPALLDKFTSPPTKIFVNGDGIDFLQNEDPLALDGALAATRAQAIVANPTTAAVLQAFGRVLAAGGEVVIRLGNHDVELSLPEVQAVIRGALGQPDAVAARLSFQLGDQPEVLDVGGARILVTHGEQDDRWNKVDYRDLVKNRGSFKYAPGSLLVKKFLNPLTRLHKLRFTSLLKPDFQGGVLTALAVDPTAMKLLFQKASISLMWQLFHRQSEVPSFADDDVGDLGLAKRLVAGLDEDERKELEALFEQEATSFAEGEETPTGARLKLARAGLELYAGVQRKLAGAKGDAYFELEPAAGEWQEAQRLAADHKASAVVLGHTHAARWKAEGGLVFANTGTWIWLMKLPDPDASDVTWTDFLTELKQNPMLDPVRQKAAKLLSRFTAVLLDERPGGGATMQLLEWDGSAILPLGASVVPAAQG
jgi:UDP-2,3-diacylglucosamine pyrophosphatase LpxH